MPNEKNDIKKNSTIIAVCIISSRVLGLVREILLARLLGTSALADALRAAIRIPNILQNLLGEGVLSASFIPTYVKLRSQDPEGAKETARQTGLLIGTIALILTVIGLIFSKELTYILAAGFDNETQLITEQLLTYLFPATFFLVLSAWCLGVLNAHKEFILSYAAPIFWNICIIGGLCFCVGLNDASHITKIAAVLFLFASLIQLSVQLPKTNRLIDISKTKISTPNKHTKEILKNLPIVITGRGIIQINSYFDTFIASFMSAGSLSTLMYAQTLYLLPISAFGLANAAASLPEFSADNESENKKIELRNKLRQTLQRASRLSFLTIIIYLILGHYGISLAFENTVFTSESTNRVYYCLLAFLPGLIPSNGSRIKTSFLYAYKKQKIVTYMALGRLVLNIILALFLCFYFLPLLSIEDSYHICGIGLAASVTNMIEYAVVSYFANKAYQ